MRIVSLKFVFSLLCDYIAPSVKFVAEKKALLTRIKKDCSSRAAFGPSRSYCALTFFVAPTGHFPRASPPLPNLELEKLADRSNDVLKNALRNLATPKERQNMKKDHLRHLNFGALLLQYIRENSKLCLEI